MSVFSGERQAPLLQNFLFSVVVPFSFLGAWLVLSVRILPAVNTVNRFPS